MLRNRRIERHQLQDYLQVSNRHTGRSMGWLGNVSEEGLMLISDLPLLVGAIFDLRMKMPVNAEGQKVVDVKATCLWCHEDETPGNYNSGFTLNTVPDGYRDLADALRHYFCFYLVEASA
ncbi:PilZ domain-containing protein [Pseudomonas cichorii]|uniref:PilZ domain-containing protein n=1 Tax=Pseudomonas cichorii TaxID=36746 RepID=UPI001C8940D5|nr:PilZ domain-containing protein [Pseudomonas cichorii]MBX8494568.1 PilZ domain-containing protein [Pseudomonas cichorii]MBX8514472.1 PilZ domain-containing protein [Pseudomonas cichorii]MBX8529819.1 PilZ domain-containing protein [Pseudomonas cichorii]MBX8573001.1 PilZ domain-containing protein [Pseudomonas cichorii]